jgi:endonuclease IV
METRRTSIGDLHHINIHGGMAHTAMTKKAFDKIAKGLKEAIAHIKKEQQKPPPKNNKGR